MKKYLSLGIAVIILAGSAYFTERSFLVSTAASPAAPVAGTTVASTQPAPATPVTTSAPAETQTPNVTLKVGDTSYRIYVPAGATVLDAMNTLTSTGNFTFTSKEFPGMGAFIESINGKANRGGSSWFLYVNGTSSDTGASQTTLKAGDTVEWRYEKNY